MNPEERIEFDETIIPREIVEEMEESYLDYAMSVIVGRAIPDVKDGLKVIHRRIIYSMYESGHLSDKPTSKSARIVGEVMGKYHPHGDAPIYEALVRMAQPWSFRYPLVEGQGNFGSIDGDAPAAMRYTEARLTPLAEYLLKDIKKRTVPFAPTFDGKAEEPLVLPALLPVLLMNGSEGIAVGMATRIPPHNLSELASAIELLVENPNVSIEELMKVVKGPDFPTGGFIIGVEGIKKAFKEGRGAITIRGRATVEQDRKERFRIVITEIPYEVNKSSLIEKIAELASKEKNVYASISDVRDESDRNGIRIVLELKRDANPQVILNNLYKDTPLQVSYGVNLLAIVDGVPKLLNLKEILEHNLRHWRDVIYKRTQYDLEVAEKRVHILEGLNVVISHLDKVIALIKASKDHKTAQEQLQKEFKLTEEQAKAILEMRLGQLTALEREKIAKELKELRQTIKELKEILGDRKRIDAVLLAELREAVERFKDERRTVILPGEDGAEFSEEDLIKSEPVVVTISRNAYIKRVPLSTFRVQARGGRGLVGQSLRSDDAVAGILTTNTLDTILCFTNTGNVYSLRVYKIPAFERTARGTPIVNLLGMSPHERVTAIVSLKEFSKPYLFMCTRRGRVKKCKLSEFANLRITGKRAITLDSDDSLDFVLPTTGEDSLLITSKKGYSVCFKESEVRAMGAYARGVVGIRLRGDDDEVVGLDRGDDSKELLVVSELGYGKRTQVSLFRQTHRASKGIISMKVRPKSGYVVSACVVSPEDEVIIISEEGMVIRLQVKEISEKGRSAMGVRLINLKEGDKVSSVEVITKEEKESPLFTSG